MTRVYFIITEADLAGLESSVNRSCALGYMPVGGILSSANAFAQPMIKTSAFMGMVKKEMEKKRSRPKRRATD